MVVAKVLIFSLFCYEMRRCKRLHKELTGEVDIITTAKFPLVDCIDTLHRRLS